MLNESWGSFIASPAVFSTRKYVDSVTHALMLKFLFFELFYFYFCMQCTNVQLKLMENLWFIFFLTFIVMRKLQYGGC